MHLPSPIYTQVNGSVSSVAVTGLLSYTMYSCTIFGYSQIVGPVSDPLSITTLQAGMNLVNLPCVIEISKENVCILIHIFLRIYGT